MSRLLSVVVPAFNEAPYIERTMVALRTALERAEISEPEVLLVDDGSDDGTAALAHQAYGPSMFILSQPRMGRFAARRAGVTKSTGQFVLFLDSRVEIDPRSLEFWHRELSMSPDRVAWKGDTRLRTGSNGYADFQQLLAQVVWPGYRGELTAYGPDSFDSFPKGAFMFVAPRTALLQAIAQQFSAVSTLPNDLISDDTGLYRELVRITGSIWLSPDFGGSYTSNRTTLGAFIRNARHRGGTFIDGYAAQPGPLGVLSWAVPLLTALALLGAGVGLFLFPAVTLGAALASVLAAGVLTAIAARRQRMPWRRSLLMATLTVPYSIGFIPGMWRGWFHRVRRRR